MKCLTKNCDGVSRARGLCRKCYGSAIYAIKKRRTSWEGLVSKGLALAPKKNKSLFTAAFEPCAFDSGGGFQESAEKPFEPSFEPARPSVNGPGAMVPPPTEPPESSRDDETNLPADPDDDPGDDPGPIHGPIGKSEPPKLPWETSNSRSG